MIKIGIDALGVSPTLIRMLINHPDVEIRWISGNNALLRRVLVNELKDIPSEANFKEINLYIGPEIPEFTEQLKANPDLKGIVYISDPMNEFEIGLPEFNRKALVRGARVAYIPQTETMLGALALMPLAKNLLLNATIFGVMVFPDEDANYFSAGDIDSETFEELRDEVLIKLQQSFKSQFKIKCLYDKGNIAKAIFTLSSHMSQESLQQIYQDFYHDHRHVMLVDGEIIDDMVDGTNKTAISISADGECTNVAVAFDAERKMSAALIVHIMDLIFGLHECAGIQ